jgi:hypothetical protein
MPKKRKPTKRQTRVRSKRLDQLDESKLALAFWLLAKQMVAGDSDAHSNKPQRKPKAKP